MTAKTPLRVLLILFLLAVSPVLLAQDHERITRFHADILVHDDASLTVTETIEVFAAGYSIERGIFRDQPRQYPVLRVERNGNPEPYHINKGFPGQTVYFGEEEVFLETGLHTYTFEYSVPHEVRSFESHDEVYWNATGNAWGFPIEKASCTITLPPGIELGDIHSEGYTGYTGEQGQDYTTSVGNDGLVHFEATRQLNSGEGLTVVATFPKGHIEHPPWYVKYIPATINTTSSRFSLLIPVMLLGYYLAMWYMVGRDPRSDHIVPRNHPPSGISPAVAHYIMNMAYESKAFTITLISLAVKGALRINQDTKTFGPFSRDAYTLERTADDDRDLSEEEERVMQELFASGSVLEIDRDNQSDILGAQSVLQANLKAQCKTDYFKLNRRQVWQGVAVMYILLIWGSILHGIAAVAVTLFMCLWLTIWTMAVFGMWRQVFTLFRGAIADRSIAQSIGAVFTMLFALPFTAGEFVGLGMIAMVVSIEFAVAIVLSMIIVATFAVLMKAPTKEGRVVLDQLKGFKKFLQGEDRSRFASENDMSFQEQYEQYLPYAIALGLEEEWSKAFESELTRSTAPTQTYEADRRRYRPTWYTNQSDSGINVGTFGNTLSTAFASAIASASSTSSSSSSSGSSGGGSSGGGGGGGGGGGW